MADEILIGGPPPTLTGWEQSYQELTGFDEVSGLDGSGVVVCVVDSGIEMSQNSTRIPLTRDQVDKLLKEIMEKIYNDEGMHMDEKEKLMNGIYKKM